MTKRILSSSSPVHSIAHRYITICTIVLLFMLLFLTYFRPVTAIRQDLGRHLLLGEIIVQTGTVPKTNLLSYTYPDASFINSHWLFEVIAYTIHATSGFDGLLVMTASMGTLAFFLVFIYALKHTGVAASILTGLLFLPILFERTDVRPEIFSFLFLSSFITILYRYRTSFTRLVFLLPFLELLWVNTHIYFFLGIVVTGLFFLERIVPERKNISRQTKILGLVLCSLIVVSLFNPNGIHGALFPILVHQNYGFPVMENQSIFFLERLFNQPSILFFKAAVLLSLTALVIARKQTKLIDWFLVVSFSLAGVLAIRNIPLFVFAAFIPLSHALKHVLTTVSDALSRYVIKKHITILQTLMLLVLFLVCCSILAKLFMYQPAGRGIEVGEAKAVDFMIKQKIKGPLYNSFDSGSYLAYRLYPQEKVFVDGRAEAYPKEFFEQLYLPMQTDPKLFEEASKQYNFNLLFISHWDQTPWPNRQFSYLLKQTSFAPVYLDDYAIIFVKRTPEHAEVIKKNEIKKADFQVPATTDTDTLIRYLYFFTKVDWEEQREQTLQQIVRHTYSRCQLVYRLSLLNQQQTHALVPGYNELKKQCSSQ